MENTNPNETLPDTAATPTVVTGKNRPIHSRAIKLTIVIFLVLALAPIAFLLSWPHFTRPSNLATYPIATKNEEEVSFYTVDRGKIAHITTVGMNPGDANWSQASYRAGPTIFLYNENEALKVDLDSGSREEILKTKDSEKLLSISTPEDGKVYASMCARYKSSREYCDGRELMNEIDGNTGKTIGTTIALRSPLYSYHEYLFRTSKGDDVLFYHTGDGACSFNTIIEIAGKNVIEPGGCDYLIGRIPGQDQVALLQVTYDTPSHELPGKLVAKDVYTGEETPLHDFQDTPQSIVFQQLSDDSTILHLLFDNHEFWHINLLDGRVQKTSVPTTLSTSRQNEISYDTPILYTINQEDSAGRIAMIATDTMNGTSTTYDFNQHRNQHTLARIIGFRNGQPIVMLSNKNER